MDVHRQVLFRQVFVPLPNMTRQQNPNFDRRFAERVLSAGANACLPTSRFGERHVARLQIRVQQRRKRHVGRKARRRGPLRVYREPKLRVERNQIRVVAERTLSQEARLFPSENTPINPRAGWRMGESLQRRRLAQLEKLPAKDETLFVLPTCREFPRQRERGKSSNKHTNVKTSERRRSTQSRNNRRLQRPASKTKTSRQFPQPPFSQHKLGLVRRERQTDRGGDVCFTSTSGS